MWKPEWTRRDFLKKTGAFAGVGLLQPVLPLIGAGKSIAAAYPDELLSIEKYTKGKVKPGMVISKDNAELVKDLAPQGLFEELKRGMEIKIGETSLKPTAFIPDYWLEATLRNQGQAVLDKKGQLWTKDGKPWIGGDPFPDPKNGLEAIWNHGFSFEKYDDIFRTASIEVDVNSRGRVVRERSAQFTTIYTNGRQIIDPKPSIPAYKKELVRITLTELAPFDIYGLGITTITYYDGSKFPDTILYVPSLRRTLRVPSTQRFEPPSPGATYFTSDFSCHNDPVLTWSWKLAGRKPFLGPSPANIGAFAKGSQDPYVFPVEKTKWPRSTWELRPEVFLLDGVSHIPGSPYGKKRMYVDALTGRAVVADTWDKQDKIWKYFVFYFGNLKVKDGRGRDVKSLSGISFSDVQKDYRTNIWLFPKGPEGGFKANSGIRIEDHSTKRAMLSKARR